jgi:hypothetical protein
MNSSPPSRTRFSSSEKLRAASVSEILDSMIVRFYHRLLHFFGRLAIERSIVSLPIQLATCPVGDTSRFQPAERGAKNTA